MYGEYALGSHGHAMRNHDDYFERAWIMVRVALVQEMVQLCKLPVCHVARPVIVSRHREAS